MVDRMLSAAFLGTLVAQLAVSLLPLVVAVPPRLAAPVPRVALLISYGYWLVAEACSARARVRPHA